MAIAMTAIGLGVVFGNIGHYTYQFIGHKAPFLILAGFALFEMVLQVNQKLNPTYKATILHSMHSCTTLPLTLNVPCFSHVCTGMTKNSKEI